MKNKKSQVSVEYLIIVGFVSFILVGVIGLAFLYSGTIKDKIKIIQINNFANKVVSTAETVYYYGSPSKATISAYLPESVSDITILGRNLYVTTQTSSGTEKNLFQSKVPIQGTITTTPGIKKIEFLAEEDTVSISMFSS